MESLSFKAGTNQVHGAAGSGAGSDSAGSRAAASVCRGYHGDMAAPDLLRQRQTILELAARHGVRNVRVFGSVARGDDRADSDLDLLVDVEHGRSSLDVIGLEQDLEELLGRPVQVVSERGLSHYLEERVLAEAVAL